MLGMFFQQLNCYAQQDTTAESQFSSWDSLMYFRFPVIIPTDTSISFYPQVNIWTIDSVSSFLVDSIGDMNRNKMFYDSLKSKAYKTQITKNLYDWLIRKNDPNPKRQLKIKSHHYYEPFTGLIIRKISFKQLDVFGPTIDDTTQIGKTRIENSANLFHTKTSIKYLKKNLMFKVGDEIQPRLMAENEKLIRDLSFIQDVNFVITPVKEAPFLVDVLIITKDVFSLGFSVNVRSQKAGSFKAYNRNVWGRGHSLEAGVVLHTNKSPKIGGQVFYGRKNINGSFIDLKAEYSNTWKKHSATFSMSKEFLTSETKTGGGIYFDRSYKYNWVYDLHPVKTDSTINFNIFNAWIGKNIRLNRYKRNYRNLYLSAGYFFVNFFDRPKSTQVLNSIFYKRKIYLGSITLANQKLVKTNLVYRYGITEDIPYGYKAELVSGYEDGDLTNRWYGHLALSTGSVFKDNNSYFSATAKAGGFLNKDQFEQGMVQGTINYFSPFHKFFGNQVRNFVEFEYTLGINRFDGEMLTLNYKPRGLRGFDSELVYGTQRLSANIESIMFLRRDFYRFKLAAYTFTDLGAIGNNKEIVFNQDLYAGFGAGLRLRNESLVFNTLEMRIAYYPDPPVDMSKWSIKVSTRIDKIFPTFNGQKPKPLFFE